MLAVLLGPVSELWLRPSLYNFFSSEWGGTLFKLLELLLIFVVIRRVVRPWARRVHRHMECQVDGCSRWGHPVPGTGYRACHHEGHNPAVAHKPGEAVTVEHIRMAHHSATHPSD
jgi:hypothetical protein